MAKCGHVFKVDRYIGITKKSYINIHMRLQNAKANITRRERERERERDRYCKKHRDKRWLLREECFKQKKRKIN